MRFKIVTDCQQLHIIAKGTYVKQTVKMIGAILVTLLVLAVAIVLTWTLGRLVFSALQSMDGDTLGATIALVGVIAVPVITFITQWGMEKKRSREQAIREKRTEFYESVVALFMQILNSSANGNEGDVADDWASQMRSLTPRMILYGSKEFVQAWNVFRQTSALNTAGEGKLGPDALNLMVASMEKTMIAARKDLGHRVSTTELGEYASTFINDLDRTQIQAAHQRISKGDLQG
ncbi:hypothetical protein EB835_20170 [Brevibacterium sp. S22]|nr:hypothetical protein EB835_20170 [Brevibacterium sp. S22]